MFNEQSFYTIMFRWIKKVFIDDMICDYMVIYIYIYIYIYNFSVNYDSVNLNYFLDIHKYLVKKAVIK